MDSPPPVPIADTASHPTAPPSEGPITPAVLLTQMQAALDKGEKELQKFGPLQASLADLTARIASLQTAIAGEDAAAAAYTDFYRLLEIFRSEVDCFIPTVRCQLDLSETKKKCIRKAIECIDGQIRHAQENRDRHYAELAQKQALQVQLDADVAWATQWNEFFATGLQAQAAAQRDAIAALKLLADPSQDACEVWFYLGEMEALLRSARIGTDNDAVCYTDVQTIGTFLDCWSPTCYTTASQQWLVAFNDAEAAAAAGASEVAVALQQATELDATVANLVANRTAAILQELKTRKCCEPASKC
jgi:hypothetical protein